MADLLTHFESCVHFVGKMWYASEMAQQSSRFDSYKGKLPPPPKWESVKIILCSSILRILLVGYATLQLISNPVSGHKDKHIPLLYYLKIPAIAIIYWSLVCL